MPTILALSSTYSVVGLIILILQIIAIINILTGGKSVGAKVLWILLVVLLPLIGVILYYLVGRGSD